MTGDDPQVIDRLTSEFRSSSRGVGVGEPVEAEPAEVPAPAPLKREGIGGGSGRHGCVKRGVETADLWNARQESADQFERAKRSGLMQRREVNQRVELLKRRRVDQRRTDQLAATVNDAVADGIDLASPLELGAERRLVHVSGLERNDSGMEQVVVLVEQRQLEAARTGVDGQDTHSAAGGMRPGPVPHFGRIQALDPRVCPAAQALVGEALAKLRSV